MSAARDGAQYKFVPGYKSNSGINRTRRDIDPTTSREYGTGVSRANMPDPIWKNVRVYHAISRGTEWDRLKNVATLAEIREKYPASEMRCIRARAPPC